MDDKKAALGGWKAIESSTLEIRPTAKPWAFGAMAADETPEQFPNRWRQMSVSRQSR